MTMGRNLGVDQLGYTVDKVATTDETLNLRRETTKSASQPKG
jgi:hypothetical protein